MDYTVEKAEEKSRRIPFSFPMVRDTQCAIFVLERAEGGFYFTIKETMRVLSWIRKKKYYLEAEWDFDWMLEKVMAFSEERKGEDLIAEVFGLGKASIIDFLGETFISYITNHVSKGVYRLDSSEHIWIIRNVEGTERKWDVMEIDFDKKALYIAENGKKGERHRIPGKISINSNAKVGDTGITWGTFMKALGTFFFTKIGRGKHFLLKRMNEFMIDKYNTVISGMSTNMSEVQVIGKEVRFLNTKKVVEDLNIHFAISRIEDVFLPFKLSYTDIEEEYMEDVRVPGRPFDTVDFRFYNFYCNPLGVFRLLGNAYADGDCCGYVKDGEMKMKLEVEVMGKDIRLLLGKSVYFELHKIRKKGTSYFSLLLCIDGELTEFHEDIGWVFGEMPYQTVRLILKKLKVIDE